ncbi:hypothetical protein BZA05DRAFT_400843 [Tricharina praecox]|uniref:uncharacterized protein n=1 Tax=Tricharina praecox TaxID=43433 RepID=UPI00221FC5FE|nr:uncharacterized protein BZA05DRAFT_400843 [Tricharina praecox]KAI5850078.1 hypothetical protein BZA05DRAFT_400843 [Tricharina praecox]
MFLFLLFLFPVVDTGGTIDCFTERHDAAEPACMCLKDVSLGSPAINTASMHRENRHATRRRRRGQLARVVLIHTRLGTLVSTWWKSPRPHDRYPRYSSEDVPIICS